jgi:Acetyltransferase (GNAT) domain/Acetyltransferase (GNAT) family
MVLRRATSEEIGTMITWAASEGWNPGLDDRDPFMAADPHGYWIAEIDGQMAAAISLVHHDDAFAFLGFYMAASAFRGRGIALALWKHVVDASRAAVIGLDGVVAQQDNYRASGFAYAHANWRYGGDIAPSGSPPSHQFVTPSVAMMPALMAFDARHNPSTRPRLMADWLTDTATRSSLVAREGDEVTGIGTIRRCREGYKIGPLFAGDPALAEALFSALVNKVGGGRIYLDIPGPNREAEALCRRHAMQPVFETARMYRGGMPQLPLESIFGITSFELG